MSGINILRRLLLKDAALGSGQASGIMSIGDNVRNLAEKRLTSYLMSAQKQGVDIDKLGEQELKYMLEMNKQKSPKVIAADSPEGKGITEALFGKKGQVIEADFGKPFSQEIKNVQKRIDSGVAATVEKMLNMTPMDAMKEANSVIGRKGIYKNLSPEDAKKILQDTEDHIFERNIDIDPEDFAEGGVAGMLGERQNFKMGRRAFLKMLAGTGAGIAGLKTGITGLGGKKVATEVATEAVKSAGSSAPPPYFFRLVEKIKFMGDKRKTPSYKERVDEYTYRGKDGSDYELIEDLDTGDIKITKDKTGVGTYGDKSFDTIEDRTEMVFKKGKADETTKGKKPPDEYEEYKVEFDQDGTVADATDIDEFSKKELIEESGDTESLTLKRAGGGVAYMLGQ